MPKNIKAIEITTTAKLTNAQVQELLTHELEPGLTVTITPEQAGAEPCPHCGRVDPDQQANPERQVVVRIERSAVEVVLGDWLDEGLMNGRDFGDVALKFQAE